MLLNRFYFICICIFWEGMWGGYILVSLFDLNVIRVYYVEVKLVSHIKYIFGNLSSD